MGIDEPVEDVTISGINKLDDSESEEIDSGQTFRVVQRRS